MWPLFQSCLAYSHKSLEVRLTTCFFTNIYGDTKQGAHCADVTNRDSRLLRERQTNWWSTLTRLFAVQTCDFSFKWQRLSGLRCWSAGSRTGNGEKLSSSQVRPSTQLLLSFPPFPVRHPDLQHGKWICEKSLFWLSLHFETARVIPNIPNLSLQTIAISWVPSPARLVHNEWLCTGEARTVDLLWMKHKSVSMMFSLVMNLIHWWRRQWPYKNNVLGCLLFGISIRGTQFMVWQLMTLLWVT